MEVRVALLLLLAAQIHGLSRSPGGQRNLLQRVDEDANVEEKVVERTPVFTTPHLRKLVNEGETIRLPCFVDQLEGFVLLWKKGDTILSVGERLISFVDARTSIQPEKEGNWLIIESARPTDQGDYDCHISAVQTKEISHSVKIRTRPIIKSTKREVTAVEGVNMTLSCYLAGGQPTPEIIWTKEGQDTRSAQPLAFGPDLLLVNVTRHSAGRYRCRADNGYATTSVARVTLTVLHRPYVEHPPVGKSDRFVHASRGEPALLRCAVDANPPATVTWSIGNITLNTSSESFPSIQYNISSNGSLHMLTISEATDSSSSSASIWEGVYTCTAVNELGTAQSNVTLSGQVGPIRFMSARVQNRSSEYTLDWNGESSVDVHRFDVVIATRSGEKLSELQVEPYNSSGKFWFGRQHLTDLQEATVYTAQVSGVNKDGQGPFSEPFIFGTRGAVLVDMTSSSDTRLPLLGLLLPLLSLSSAVV